MWIAIEPANDSLADSAGTAAQEGWGDPLITPWTTCGAGGTWMPCDSSACQWAALTPFLQGLVDRGSDGSKGLLVIIDRGKSLRAAVRQAFGGSALVQRCQWHKQENVARHLNAQTRGWGSITNACSLFGTGFNRVSNMNIIKSLATPRKN